MVVPRSDAPSLSVLTQNIRVQRPDTLPGQPDHWGDRAPVLLDLLREADADVVATQEVTWPQLLVLDEALEKTHLRLGLGREGGGRGEHTLLHLRRERFEVLDWDQFWLSEQPARIGSMGWDALCPRVAVWARVRDRSTGGQLVVACTHLDHAGSRARSEGVALVAERLTEAAGAEQIPIVLMGDFNAAAGTSEPWGRLVQAGFTDAHEEAPRRDGADLGTFPEYGAAVPGGERIDWIMTRGVRVLHYRAHDHMLGDVHASDHVAVQAAIQVTGA